MTNLNPDENLPGPFKNGRLTEPEDESDTRPTRVNQDQNRPMGPGAGEQTDNDQTRATPVRPQTDPWQTASDPVQGDPNGQARAHPVYDPHGQTQDLPAQPARTGSSQMGDSRPQPAGAQPNLPQQNPAGPLPKASRRPDVRLWIRRYWLWGALTIVLFGSLIASGGYSGFLSGQAERRAQAEAAAITDLTQQVSLGFDDLQAGRYDVARQRFEFVINQDPNFPGATDGLVQALQVLNATATPTPPAATPTLTPTRDLRPVEELLAQALAQMKNSDWAGVIDTLNGLRKEDPGYQVTRVDGYLYIALRYQGVDKILNQSNLEGGIYDLSLAEQFGPLDSQALGTRNLARLYIIGSSFWEAIPEQAVYYFSQVAAAAPYLRDASGWTARERYRQSLVQYGDQLATAGNWCDAQVQYETALSMQDDAAISEKAQNAAVTCSPPTDVPTLTATATLTPTLTASPTATPPLATTAVPATPIGTTAVPTTAIPTTPIATTPVPTTAAPTTPVPSTPPATTAAPTSPPPTTEVPPTPVPPTELPTTAPPPVETTPAPPPDTLTPTETTAPAPAATTSVPLQGLATETPTVTPTETPIPAGSSSPFALQEFIGLLPSLERMFYE